MQPWLQIAFGCDQTGYGGQARHQTAQVFIVGLRSYQQHQQSEGALSQSALRNYNLAILVHKHTAVHKLHISQS